MARYRETIKRLFPYNDNFGDMLGYDVLKANQARSVTTLKITEHHISPSGAVHGGVISAFVDFSMGAALFAQMPEDLLCSTIEFKINYLTPVKTGETIYAESHVKHMGKSHAVTESRVYRGEGPDVALALGTYNLYPFKPRKGISHPTK